MARSSTWPRTQISTREASDPPNGKSVVWHRVDGRKNDRLADFRSGSSTDLLAPKSDRRSTPENRHQTGLSSRLFCADIVAKVFSSWRMKILRAADAL
jgi:hypothetical protein